MSVSVPDLCSILFHSLATRQDVQVYLKAPHKKVFRCRSKDQKKPYYTTITQQQARSTHVPHWHWCWHFMYVQFRTSRVRVSSFMSHVPLRRRASTWWVKHSPATKKEISRFLDSGLWALGPGFWEIPNPNLINYPHLSPTPHYRIINPPPSSLSLIAN